MDINKIFVPRKYQIKAVENFQKWIVSEQKLASITIPVGTGKTITTALCLATVPELKVLWVAHREELINQAKQAIETIIPSVQISIEMADQKANCSSQIVIGSVQTLARERKNLDSFHPDLIVIDEYHHYSEGNIQYDGLLKRWPKAKVLGLTATPFRSSGEFLPLGNVLITMDIGTAVEKGYLVPPVPKTLTTNVSLADVKTRMGDFALDDLSKTINVDDRNKLIAKKLIQLVKEEKRQGLLFAVDVAHSKAMFQILKNEVRTAEIYGETNREERRAIIEKIRNKEIDIVTNNMVLTEGTDIPHLSFICMARPTKFLGLYCQAIGRGLRTYQNKADCIIVDVHDKIKVKQSRVTFSDMAVAGDLYGDKKRAANVLKADVPVEDEISKKLKNFPIMINRCEVFNKTDRWTTDDESFSVSSWVVGSDQWIVTWSSETKEPKIIQKRVFVPWTELPVTTIEIRGREVKHHTFGNGKVIKIVDRDNPKILVEFAWGNQKTMEMISLHVQKFVKEYSPNETETIKTDKLFYICLPDFQETGRVIHFVREGRDLILKDDKRLSRLETDAYLQGEAMKDGILQLVRTNAKWKFGPASDKQKLYVEGMSDRIGFDIDIDSLTKGDASAIIEQAKWQEIIHRKFGTNYKDKLLGYDNDIENI